MMKKIGLSGKGKLDFYCELYLNSRGLSVLSNSRLMLGVIKQKSSQSCSSFAKGAKYRIEYEQRSH